MQSNQYMHILCLIQRSNRRLTSTFPAGSITGAPKKSAMKYIKQLERHERQLYWCNRMDIVSSTATSMLPFVHYMLKTNNSSSCRVQLYTIPNPK